jgi:hypothetical protein
MSVGLQAFFEIGLAPMMHWYLTAQSIPDLLARLRWSSDRLSRPRAFHELYDDDWNLLRTAIGLWELDRHAARLAAQRRILTPAGYAVWSVGVAMYVAGTFINELKIPYGDASLRFDISWLSDIGVVAVFAPFIMAFMLWARANALLRRLPQ